nr:PAS domain-containing sensor histidine kinase [Aquimixticola soesokkakensis]
MDKSLAPGPVTRVALRLDRRATVLALAGGALLIAGLLVPPATLGLLLFCVGGCLVWTAAVARLLAQRHRAVRRRFYALISSFVEHDASPSFTTDIDGVIGYQNPAATMRFGGQGGETLLRILGQSFASPAATLYRLQTRAQAKGSAREDVITRHGHLRISVHATGEDGFLWRLEDIIDRTEGELGGQMSAPVLTLSRSGALLSMNDALSRLVGGDDVPLERILPEGPLRTGDVYDIATPDGARKMRLFEVETALGRREIYFMPDTAVHQAAEWVAFDTLPVALLKVSPTGDIEDANRSARDLLGVCQLENQPLGNFVEGLGRSVVDWVADAAEGRGIGRPEFMRASEGANDTFIQIVLNRIDAAGSASLIAVLSDATELKTLEAKFVQSQKMQAIGQLAGGIAHDFNNLLTAISGHCDLLLLRHDQADPEYGDLVQIHQNANRAASLVGQLLAFSRKQTLKPERVVLRDALADLTHLLNRLVGERVTLTLNHDPDLWPIRADKRQLEQVLMNLVVNARDAMSGGGQIKIETNNAVLQAPFTRDRVTLPAGDYVVIKVSDEGCGIPPDRLQKVFEPFYTTKRTGEGTGLGLSTAYGIIKQTGGYIFVDSVVGIGTSFLIYLPSFNASDPVAEAAPASLPVASPERGSGVVLLVEDEAPVRAFASRALRMRGYTVIEAENAEEALETLEDKSLEIDVFVTDVIMPGMDGPSWVSQALKDRPGVKVVFVSGYAEDSFSEQQSRIPNSVFLPKPFSLSELTATVHDQIH